MNIFNKIFFVLVTVLFAFLIPSLVKANDVSLGGMHLDGYCRSLGQGGVKLTNNIWTCESGLAIDMNAACNWQYPNKSAVASQTTQDNPYTWTCFEGHTQTTPTPSTSGPTAPNTPTPTRGTIPTPTPNVGITPTPTPTPTPSGQLTRLGGMDLDSYCLNRGLPRAVVSNEIWTCGQGGRAIDMNNACQWQYVPTAIARQDAAGNPYTWSCYASNVTPTPTPTPVNPTPTQSVSSPTPTPTTSNLRVRRSIYSLSPDEVQRLVSAINTLRNNGEYADFMNRHIQAMMTETPVNDPTTDRNVAHRGPAFLTWHRAFIYEYEERLRAVDPTVTLPYWPFESDSGSTPRVFTAAYFGSDGNRTQNDRVTDGPFANWGILRRIGRDADTGQTSLPTPTDVNSVLQFANYDSAPYNEQSAGFVMGMEGWIGTNSPWGMHNRVHGYVGGDMGTMDSANDPIFFLLHANVDRLWWQWQLARGITTFQPAGGGPAGHNLNDPLRFLLRVPTNADVLDIQNDMGYTYN